MRSTSARRRGGDANRACSEGYRQSIALTRTLSAARVARTQKPPHLPARGLCVCNRSRRLLFVDRDEALVEPRARGLLAGVHRRLAVDDDVEPLVRRETGAGRDEPTHDDVLLETAEVVRLAADSGLGEDLRGLLEGGRRDERLGREARLRD